MRTFLGNDLSKIIKNGCYGAQKQHGQDSWRRDNKMEKISVVILAYNMPSNLIYISKKHYKNLKRHGKNGAHKIFPQTSNSSNSDTNTHTYTQNVPTFARQHSSWSILLANIFKIVLSIWQLWRAQAVVSKHIQGRQVQKKNSESCPPCDTPS